ncbi:GH39 family glycosyl hydrolase [Ktedonospora formicarum]|uniref:Alpha-L-arabinofuranosidase n=1 Tax=Ktedonospora formicarum TaxID=2778364 RepID=A0A8J3IAK5_9CHLR|nr:hypothetical protein [Ktedonospora formicarum]GHO47769.1 hypothetical protein KSX_59320 [Ktedonospora formicarum]
MFGLFKKRLPLLIGILVALVALGVAIPTSIRLFAANNTTLSIDMNSNNGNVNPFVWGVNAPDKYLAWAGNPTTIQRIRDANIKMVRVGAIQYAIYRGAPMCSSPTVCNFTHMDAVLKSVFDAGAEPLFVIAGYPGGIAEHDWKSYALFMKQVINRYNVQLVLGHKVRYWEMWNEPTNEQDGKITDKADWANFVKIVGGAMKGVDASIHLVGPAAPWADLGQGGVVDYAAKNTNDLLDILSWHDYGKYEESDDQKRLTDTSRYADEVHKVQAIQSQSGKHFGTALTEYNMAWNNLASGNNQFYHTNYDAVYAASTIMTGIQAKADMFNFYALSEAGDNNLGLLNNQSFAPYTPYYTFFLFGNHTGTTLLKSSGKSSMLDLVASRSADGKKIFVTVVNKDMKNQQALTINLNSSVSGRYSAYTLDGSTLPLSGKNGTYANGQFAYTMSPLSVVSFDIALDGSQGAPTPTPTVAQPTPTPVQPTPTPVKPTPTPVKPTPTPTTPMGDYMFSFENGTSGWEPNGDISKLASSAGVARDGKQSLLVSLNSVNSNDFPFVFNDTLPTSLPGGKTVTAYIYAAKGSNIKATLFVMDQNWKWYGGSFVALPAGTWYRLSYTIPATMPGSARTLGVQLYGVQATVYIDAVTWT